MLLAVDPGKGSVRSIGWAIFDDNDKLIQFGQDTLNEFIERLESLEGITEVVNEEYRIFQKRVKQHSNSKVETIQTIGAIKSWCIRNKIPQVEQRSDILNGAQSLFQIPLPENHNISHQVSAILHGKWYLYKRGRIKSALQEKIAEAK